MIHTLIGAFARELATRLGWLLAGAGLILPAMQLYDWMTCAPTLATVTAIENACEWNQCRICDCNWRRRRVYLPEGAVAGA